MHGIHDDLPRILKALDVHLRELLGRVARREQHAHPQNTTQRVGVQHYRRDSISDFSGRRDE